MVNNRLLTFFSVLAALAAAAAPANAAEAEFGAKLLVCNACHGDSGVPKNPTIPIIWGQRENYLVKQLHDFQSGARDFEVMPWMVKTLSPEETASAAPATRSLVTDGEKLRRHLDSDCPCSASEPVDRAEEVAFPERHAAMT
jgi:cytochrome c553